MTNLTKKPIENITSEMQNLFEKHLGPGRFARTAYRVREQATAKKLEGINVFDKDKLVGTVSITPLLIAKDTLAYLLGPLLIDKSHRSKGLGQELIKDAIELAKNNKAKAILLVGDIAYYKKAGFKQIPMSQITLPGPVDPQRLLIFEISEGALETLKGPAKAV